MGVGGRADAQARGPDRRRAVREARTRRARPRSCRRRDRPTVRRRFGTPPTGAGLGVSAGAATGCSRTCCSRSATRPVRRCVLRVFGADPTHRSIWVSKRRGVCSVDQVVLGAARGGWCACSTEDVSVELWCARRLTPNPARRQGAITLRQMLVEKSTSTNSSSMSSMFSLALTHPAPEVGAATEVLPKV